MSVITKEDKTSVSKNNAPAVDNLKLISDVFKKIEEEIAQISDKKEDKPSASINNPSAADNLKLISDVFKKIEEETIQIAELLFEYLIEVPDEQVITGTIAKHKNRKINKYIAILNRLFRFSRNDKTSGGFRIINREMIEGLDKKTYMICMCFDGGVSVDILCDIVNTENSARTPTRSPIRIMVKQAFAPTKNNRPLAKHHQSP